MKFEHGGDIRNLANIAGCSTGELLDFSANINPLGYPESLRRVLSRHLSEVVHYPDPQSLTLRKTSAAALSVSVEQVVCGNGSTELLYALPRALSVRKAIIPVPGYIDYTTAAVRAGIDITTII